jgi:trehalose 6-phosphate phosphatase
VDLDSAWAPVVEAPAAAALLVDFDGTLAPIVDDPARAAPVPESAGVLSALAARVALVAVVTGRPVAFVRRHLPDPRVVVVGQYGLERDDGGGVVTDARVAAYAPAVDAAARDLERAWPALRVERKGETAITLHWRERPESAPDPDGVAAIAVAHGLVAWPARMACELRPPVEVDKGTAVAQLLGEREVEVAAFAGDDDGDRRAFAALDDWVAASSTRRALRIGIASDESPPGLLAAADLVVAGPRDLVAQLGALAAAI